MLVYQRGTKKWSINEYTWWVYTGLHIYLSRLGMSNCIKNAGIGLGFHKNMCDSSRCARSQFWIYPSASWDLSRERMVFFQSDGEAATCINHHKPTRISLCRCKMATPQEQKTWKNRNDVPDKNLGRSFEAERWSFSNDQPLPSGNLT